MNENRGRYASDFKTIIYLTGFLILQTMINVPLCFFFLIPNFNHFNSEWEIYYTIILKNQEILLTLFLFSGTTLFLQVLASSIFIRKFNTLEAMKPHKLHWVWSYLLYLGIITLLIFFLDFFIHELHQGFLWPWIGFSLIGLAFSGILVTVSFVGLMVFALPLFLTDFPSTYIRIIGDHSIDHIILGMEAILVGDYIPAGGIWVMLTILRFYSPMLLFFPIILFKITQSHLEKPAPSTDRVKKTIGEKVKRDFGIYSYLIFTVAYWVVLPVYLLTYYVQGHSIGNETAISVGSFLFVIMTIFCTILPLLLLTFLYFKD